MKGPEVRRKMKRDFKEEGEGGQRRGLFFILAEAVRSAISIKDRKILEAAACPSSVSRKPLRLVRSCIMRTTKAAKADGLEDSKKELKVNDVGEEGRELKREVNFRSKLQVMKTRRLRIITTIASASLCCSRGLRSAFPERR
jgi:hypothetical protein